MGQILNQKKTLPTNQPKKTTKKKKIASISFKPEMENKKKKYQIETVVSAYPHAAWNIFHQLSSTARNRSLRY